MVELVRLSAGGRPIETPPVEEKNAQGARIDHYHVAPLEGGRHEVVVTLRVMETGKEVEKKFEVVV